MFEKDFESRGSRQKLVRSWDSHDRNLIAVGGKFWAAECCSLLARSDEGQKRSAADAEMIMADHRFNWLNMGVWWFENEKAWNPFFCTIFCNFILLHRLMLGFWTVTTFENRPLVAPVRGLWTSKLQRRSAYQLRTIRCIQLIEWSPRKIPRQNNGKNEKRMQQKNKSTVYSVQLAVG